ncbi:MAG: protein kinase [Planctomycetota bacterium]
MSADPPVGDGRPAGPLTGRVLAGTYRVGGVLGEGAMGIVYAAQHALLGSSFAIKVLKPERAADEHVRARFLREAMTLSRLVDPHIVTVRHVGEEEGLVYLVTDLCPGRTLSELIAEEGPLPEARAIALADDILQALSAAHAAGVVHRDLKPANVMVERRPDGTEHARVLDFGLARLLEREDGLPPGALLTQDGEMVGTVAYMAPEQIRASDDVGAAADQFATGVILYEMLAGELPFAGTSTLSMMMHVIESPPRPLPVEGLHAVSAPVRATLERALAKEPAQRFPDAVTFRRALAGEAIAPPPPRPAPVVADAPSRPRHARRWAWPAAAIVLAAGVTAAFVLRPAVGGVSVAAIEAARTSCDHEAAATLAARRAAERPDDAEAVLLAAELAVAAGHLDADRELERALRSGGRSSRWLAATARYRWRVKEDRAAALDAFDEALLTDDTPLEVHLDRVELLLEAARVGEAPRPELNLEGLIQIALEDLEQRAANDPRAFVLRADHALDRAAKAEDATERDTWEGRAEDALVRACDTAGSWGAPWTRRAELAERRAYRAGAAGAHADALRWREQARDDLDAAVRRAEAAPGTYCQVTQLDTWRLRRAAARLAVEDTAGALEDVRAALGGRLADRGAAASLAWHLRYAGHYEEAILLYEQIAVTTQDGNAWFDLGFCHEVLAVEAELSGNVAEARERHRRAIDTWERAVAVLRDASVALAYRGEARLRLAEIVESEDERADLMAAAGEDFERAREAHPGNREVEFRRSVWLARMGDPARAVADLAASLGEHRDLNPAFYARVGILECALAGNHLQAGDVEAARAALARATSWCDRVPRAGDEDDVGVAHLRTWIAILHADVDPGSGGAKLAAWVASTVERLEADGAPARARDARVLACVPLEASLADGEAAKRVRHARWAEIARAYWPPRRRWLTALGAALEAAGRSAEAAQARSALDP